MWQISICMGGWAYKQALEIPGLESRSFCTVERQIKKMAASCLFISNRLKVLQLPHFDGGKYLQFQCSRSWYVICFNKSLRNLYFPDTPISIWIMTFTLIATQASCTSFITGSSVNITCKGFSGLYWAAALLLLQLEKGEKYNFNFPHSPQNS